MIVKQKKRSKMSIKGRTKYSFYLDSNDVELIRSLFESAGYKAGLSGFFHEYSKKFADQIRKAMDDDEIDVLIDSYRQEE
jgi:hypothetical protein